MEVINGFQCKNCTDVDYAKKHIDPQHPKDGPYGIDAKDQPEKAANNPAVSFGGVLASLNQPVGAASDLQQTDRARRSGQLLDVTA